MDNTTAKNLLSAYRPNGADSSDPAFKSALDQCDADPELRDWFDAERAFDRRMIQAFQSIRPPAHGKESVCVTASLEGSEPTRFRRWSLWVAPLAAGLLIAVGFLFQFHLSSQITWEPGAQLLAQLASDRRPLDYEAENMMDVREWLQSRGAPVPDTLPEVLLAARGQGCKLFEDEHGNVVSMLCITLNGEFVHVFVFDEATRHYVTLETDAWQREGNWNMRALERDGLLLAVATRGDTTRLSKML